MADSIKKMTGTKDALGRTITTSPAEYEKNANECPFDPRVVDDYQRFTTKKKLDWIERFEFVEDGTGRHAVKVTAGKDGT